MAIVIVYLAISFLLAYLTESLTEYVIGTLFDKIEKLKPWRWTLMYIAAIVGVFLAYYYKLDLLALIGSDPTPVGFAFTGLIIGRGANYLHAFVSKYLLQKQFNTSAQGDTENPVA